MRWRLNKEKLLWLRLQRGWSQEEASRRAGMNEKRQYVRFEDGETLRPRRAALQSLALAFDLASGDELVLQAHQAPDVKHLTTFQRYKRPPFLVPPEGGASARDGSRVQAQFSLVAMDVDGTVLQGLEYSWKVIWNFLDKSDKRRQWGMQRYLREEISYSDWCSYCCLEFIKLGLRKSDFIRIVRGIQVVQNFRSEARRLKDQGVKLAVISGGLDVFLDAAFPDHRDYFDFEFINQAHFSRSGRLLRIDPTPFDYAGKVLGIEELCGILKISRDRVAYIGEGHNDRYVAGQVGRAIALCPRSQEVREGFDVVIDHPDFELVSLALELPLGAPPAT